MKIKYLWSLSHFLQHMVQALVDVACLVFNFTVSLVLTLSPQISLGKYPVVRILIYVPHSDQYLCLLKTAKTGCRLVGKKILQPTTTFVSFYKKIGHMEYVGAPLAFREVST